MLLLNNNFLFDADATERCEEDAITIYSQIDSSGIRNAAIMVSLDTTDNMITRAVEEVKSEREKHSYVSKNLTKR